MLSANDVQNSNTETSALTKEQLIHTVKTRKHDEMQYLEMIQDIIDHGTKKEDRTG